MATAEEGGSPSNNMASSYGGGGVGGKFRKKLSRKQPTPYDRPPTAYRGGANNNGNTSSGWMTKLFVAPASKLISYGANRFFSSVFRKRLPPPPPPPQPPEVNNDVTDGVQGTVLNVQESLQEPADGTFSVPSKPRSNEMHELEQLLKQKTFSRSEISHLTKLLQSKALEAPAGDDDQRNEVTASDINGHDQLKASPLDENRNFGIRSATAHVRNSKVLEDDIATPAELAKAYMGSRPSKGSSVLGVRHQGGTEDTGLHSNAPFTPKMPLNSLTNKTPVGLAASENVLITPRSRGRSAIYNMARTPYSRAHPTSIFKGSRSNSSGNTGPSLSSSTLSPLVNGEKLESQPMTLKRRSSVLNDEIGLFGSVRRTRQKSNLLASKNHEITHGMGFNSHTNQKLQLIGEPSHKVLQAGRETESESILTTSRACVPSKSTEVAARIFQHLEKLTPKEKSSESKLGSAREKSQMKLTSGMLTGQTSRSMEDVDPSKLLMGDPHDHKLGDTSTATLPVTRNFSSQKARNIEENGPKEPVVPSGIWNPVMKNDSAGSLQTSFGANKTIEYVEHGTTQPPPKKRAFRMSAQEDSLEPDDEVHSNGLAPTLFSEKIEPVKAPVTDSKPAPPEVSKSVETAIQASEVAVVSHSAIPPFKFATSEKPVESTSSPVFSPSSKFSDKFPALPSESNTKESAVESSSRLFNVSTSAGSQLKIPDLDKSGHLSPPKAGDTNNKSDTVLHGKGEHVTGFSSAAFDHINQASTGSGFFFASTPSISNIAPSGLSSSTSTTTSSGSILGLSAKPSNLEGQNFKFGTSVDPTTSAPVASVSNITEPAEVKPKVDTNPSPGSTVIPNSSVTAQPAANPEKSITFGLGSSVNTTSVPGSLFSSASKSTESGAGTLSQGASLSFTPPTLSPGTVSQGTPVLSVSSASAPLFSMNGNASGSSFSNPKVSPAFSFSSSAASSTTTVAPGSGQSASVFKFGGSPVTEGNVVSSSSASTPSFGFGFGSGSGSGSGTSSTSTTDSALINSATALPKFNFGGNSSVLAGSSTSATSGIFTFGGSSSTASAAVNTGSSSSAANVFGSGWQSSGSSNFGSSSTTSGFSFGASSASAAASTAPMSFNSHAGATQSPFFSFNAAATASPSLPAASPPVFGNPPVNAFGSTLGNDQMNAEDSMAEDPVQSSLFGQPSVSPAAPSSGFTFGSTAPSQPNNPFMFASQQNQAAPPNPSSFQGTGSLELTAGGSFSLGSGAGDKSGRRIVKVNRSKYKKR
ncbi:nuclear pore complex protein NUP1 [Andrographis paniculata]|uniref:nuclear pore complex protein NUP1 n=1 Tax=Andrographis paniculata TaxID=175694 RepID=UPI0021E939BE|nr:nuclear pore complex protein NUP1 [Andrographis paniculata]